MTVAVLAHCFMLRLPERGSRVARYEGSKAARDWHHSEKARPTIQLVQSRRDLPGLPGALTPRPSMLVAVSAVNILRMRACP